MNRGTSCPCLYYYSVMTYYTAGRHHISAQTVMMSRLRSSWDGLAREHVDHDHHHHFQYHQLPSPSSFLFCQVAAEETKRLSVNSLFSLFFSPLLSSASAASWAGLQELQKCVSSPSASAVVHRARKREREKKKGGVKKGKCFVEKCVQSVVRACVCASCSHLLFLPLLCPFFPIWACWYIAETFLKKKVKQAVQDRRTA